MLIILIFVIYNNYFEKAAKIYHINPQILKAIALVESNLKNTVHVNPNGSKDYGIMQINSFWVEKYKLDTLKLLYEPLYNIMWGAYILSLSIKAHGYTWKAVGYYHSPNYLRQKSYLKKVMAKYNELKEKNE